MPIFQSKNRVAFNQSILAKSVAFAISPLLAINLVFAAEDAPIDVEKKGYERIIVTGQKITRTLQETPASIAVFSTDKIEQQNLGDFSEVLFETANVHSEANGSFSIRGINATSVTGGGNSGLASVYVDGASLPSRIFRNGFSTWDVSQVEVLRGPQSTIQGRNSLAGAIILTTQAPTHEFSGKYRVQVGQNGEQEFAVAVGGGLIKDELAFRFSAEKESFDGFNYNITRQEDADYRDDELYRLKLLYTPQALPELTAQLSLTHATTDVGPTYVNAIQTGDQFKQRLVTANDAQDIYYENDIANLEVNYAINDTWQFLSLSTYSKATTHWDDFDSDSSFLDNGTRGLNEEAKTISQEFRLTYNGDNLSGVIGAYYFKSELPAQILGITNVDISQAGINSEFLQTAFALDVNTADFVVSSYDVFNPGELLQQTQIYSEVTTRAIFADVTYAINEQWDIFGGIRWDNEEQLNNDAQAFSLANIDDLPNPDDFPAQLAPLFTGINAQIISAVDSANSGNGDATLVNNDFSEIIPKIGVSYRWNDDMTTSFSLQQGYRSGGVGVNQATANPYQYDSEKTTNYEFSMRSFWLDGDLMVNANVFYIDWQDQQVNVQLSSNSFDTEIQNVGESTLKGFEVEAYYQVNDNLELTASIGQADSEFKDFLVVIPVDNSDDTIQDLSGRSFADSPEWTGNFSVNYMTENGFIANVSANFANSSLSVVNPFVVDVDAKNDARTLVNMQIGYEWESIGIYLIGKNIFDEEYFTQPLADEESFDASSIVRLGGERQMSISLRGSF